MKIAGKLISETRHRGIKSVTEYMHQQKNGKHTPYIIEKQYGNSLKYSQKELSNGKHLEVYEDNGKIYKVLTNSKGRAVAVNILNNGEKQKFRLFANTKYCDIIADFFDKTGEFLSC
ncbi:hypothetical protein IJZ97_04670 [bacterium]|nr:hypothetical protein [bacterium]